MEELLQNIDPKIEKEFSRNSLRMLNGLCISKRHAENRNEKKEILSDIIGLQLKLYDIKQKIMASEQMRLDYAIVAKEGNYSCWDEVTLTEAHLINLQKEYQQTDREYKIKRNLYYISKKHDGYIRKASKHLMRNGLEKNMKKIESLDTEK